MDGARDAETWKRESQDANSRVGLSGPVSRESASHSTRGFVCHLVSQQQLSTELHELHSFLVPRTSGEVLADKQQNLMRLAENASGTQSEASELCYVMLS